MGPPPSLETKIPTLPERWHPKRIATDRGPRETNARKRRTWSQGTPRRQRRPAQTASLGEGHHQTASPEAHPATRSEGVTPPE
eukprot:8918404-Pyramimonas_sp.AAC.1